MSDMNEIVIHIKKELNRLPSTPSDRILLRVPNYLRRVKKEAYEPDIISIGPYHRGKDHLAAMEELKFRYLELLLQRRNEISIANYVEALKKLNEKAKNCYEEQFLEERRERCLEEGRPDDFLETMLVDGCFIVELIRKSVAENESTEDTIFRSKMTLYSLKHDLLLLENQLPFFVLQELFNMTLLPNEDSNLVGLIFRFFNIVPGLGYKRREKHKLPKVPHRHLLGLIHDNWLPSPQGVKDYLENERTNRPITTIPCSAGYQSSAESTEEIKLPSAWDQLQCSAESTEEFTSLSAECTEQIPLLSSATYTKQISSLSADYTKEIKGPVDVLEIPKYTEQIPSLSPEYTVLEKLRKSINRHTEEYTKQIRSLSPEIQSTSAAYTVQSEICTLPTYPKEIEGHIGSDFTSGKEASKEDDAGAHIRCATELHEAGIKFKRAKGCSIFDITFAKGVLEIPKLTIQDRTESLLRNLIAYEQFWKDNIYQVTDYARFMDCLINSNKDVELLCRSGIIDNWLGDDKVIATMFNRLLDSIMIDKRSFYSEIYIEVNEYCGRKWNLWKAILRHDYFNNPWALISFLAAVFLLLLTVLQTVLSVLSYHS